MRTNWSADHVGRKMRSVLRDSEEQQVGLFAYFLSPQQTESIIVVTSGATQDYDVLCFNDVLS